MTHENQGESKAGVSIRFIKPIENYQQIKCLVGSGKKLPDLCYQACGLACAEDCLRWSDRVCLGCPCLNKQEAP